MVGSPSKRHEIEPICPTDPVVIVLEFFSRNSGPVLTCRVVSRRGAPHAVTRNYARRVVRPHRGRFYERLYGIIINELKCGGKPSRSRRGNARTNGGARASPAICSAGRLTIPAVNTLIARGISALTGRADRRKSRVALKRPGPDPTVTAVEASRLGLSVSCARLLQPPLRRFAQLN